MYRVAATVFGLAVLVAIRAGAAATPADVDNDKYWKRTRIEQSRLRELVKLSEKAAKPTALIPHFKRLADKAAAEHVRREAAFRLARAWLKVRRTAETERLFDELSSPGDDAWARKAAIELGDLRRTLSRHDEAIEAYERVLRKNVTQREAVIASLAVAEILIERGSRDKAREALQYGREVAARLYEEDRKALKETLNAIDGLLRSLDRERKVAEEGEAAVLLREGNAAFWGKDYGTALAKYGEILERFPDSTEADEAGYRKGLALFHAGKPRAARLAWEVFVREGPEGPWRGHALVNLADVYLEHDLDPVSARRALDRFFKGIEKRLANWPDAAGDAWIRRAVIEYIDNHSAECIEALERAQEFRPAPEEIAKHGIFWGPGRLLSKIQKGEEITSAEVRRGGSPRARTAIVLGDLYFEMQEDSKAQRLLAKLNPPLRPITGEVLTEASWRKLSKRGGRGGFDPVDWLKELTGRQGGKGEIVRTTMSQRAYAGLREAMCLEQAFEFDLALARYGTFLVDFKDSRWAPDALIRGGAMANQMQPGGPLVSEALMKTIQETWPKCYWASTAALWYGVSAMDREAWDEAEHRLKWGLARYPTTIMRKRVGDLLRLIEAKRNTGARGRNGKDSR